MTPLRLPGDEERERRVELVLFLVTLFGAVLTGVAIL